MTKPLLETAATIADTTVHDFVPADGGAPWRAFLHVPSEPAPEAGWAVLYMTDGNAVIGTAVEAMRAQAFYPLGANVDWGVIVAIGYPVEGAYDPLRRSWDLGPPPGKTYPPFCEGTPEVRTGGAGQFLAFIEDELKPWVASRTRIDERRQALTAIPSAACLRSTLCSRARIRSAPSSPPALLSIGKTAPSTASRSFRGAAPDGLKADVILSAGEYETEKLAPFQIGAEDEENAFSRRS